MDLKLLRWLSSKIQNLMNRLSLALKRTAHLEGRLSFSERNSHQRKEKLSVLDDEIQILRSNQNQVHFQLKKNVN